MSLPCVQDILIDDKFKIESLPGVNEENRLLFIYFYIVRKAKEARDQTETYLIIFDDCQCILKDVFKENFEYV